VLDKTGGELHEACLVKHRHECALWLQRLGLTTWWTPQDTRREQVMSKRGNERACRRAQPSISC
jgi:hypothetical protein